MNALIIFSKIPIPGTVKTRLIGSISAESASSFASCMLLDLFNKFRHNYDYDVFFVYSPLGKLSKLITDIPENFGVYHQFGENIGTKMYNAMNRLFGDGYEKVVLIGSDIPGINQNIVREAFNSLDEYDIAINPTVDGGYYLIGTSISLKAKVLLTSDIKWSTKSVFESSLDIAKDKNWSVHIGKTLQDIDTMEDILSFNNFNDISKNTAEYIRKLKEKDK